MIEQPLPPVLDAGREAELTERIDRWLAHMTWRPDFARWREGRIWQERAQADRLRLIERYGGALGRRRILDLGSGMGGASVALALEGAAPLAFESDRLLAELARVLRPGGRALLTVINRYAFRDPHYHLPLLNWMPRPLAEALIAWRGRSKGGSAFSDRQELSEMHYYTIRGFRRVAASYGFRVGDIREDRVRRGEGTAGGLKGRVRDALRRLGLAHIAYIVYRTLFQGTF